MYDSEKHDEYDRNEDDKSAVSSLKRSYANDRALFLENEYEHEHDEGDMKNHVAAPTWSGGYWCCYYGLAQAFVNGVSRSPLRLSIMTLHILQSTNIIAFSLKFDDDFRNSIPTPNTKEAKKRKKKKKKKEFPVSCSKSDNKAPASIEVVDLLSDSED